MIVFLVRTQVFCQVIDAFGQECYLHARRTSIFIVLLEFTNQFFLFLANWFLCLLFWSSFCSWLASSLGRCFLGVRCFRLFFCRRGSLFCFSRSLLWGCRLLGCCFLFSSCHIQGLIERRYPNRGALY